MRAILLEAAHELNGSGAPDDVGEYISAGLATHPRNELDFVCIADLNCWRRHPFVMWQKNPVVDFARDEDMFFASWTARMPMGEGESRRFAEPIAILVSDLWQKLAYRDPALKAIADGFRMTDTPGMGKGNVDPKPLRPLVHAGTHMVLRANPSLAVDG